MAVAAGLLLAAAPPMPPAEAPMPLAEAVRLAVARDPALQAAGVRVREAQAAVDAALGAFDLRLVADLQYSRARDEFEARPGQTSIFGIDVIERDERSLSAGVVQPLVWGTRIEARWFNDRIETNSPFLSCIQGLQVTTCWESRLELQLAQPLLRGFGRDANEAQVVEARAVATVADRQRAEAVSTRLENIVGTYAELAFAQSDRRIRGQALELAEEQLATTQARVELGRLAPADLPVVQQAVAQRQREVYNAAQLVEDRAAALASALHVERAPAVELPDAATPPETEAEAERAAEAHNPSLAAIDADVERLRQALPAFEDAAQPRLDLTARVQRGGTGETFGGAVEGLPPGLITLYALGLSFEWPPANGAAEGQLSQARLALERARLDREARRIDVRRAAGDAWRAVRTSERNIALARTIADLSARSVEAEREKFEAGRSTAFDVLRLQQAYAESLLAVERARTDHLLAVTRLAGLTGALLQVYGVVVE
jgi:outer membrane protein TolC